MPFCTRCGFQADREDNFCRKCGNDLRRPGAGSDFPPSKERSPGGPSAGGPPPGKNRLAALIGVMVLSLAGMGAVFLFTSKGCGRTEGSLVAAGQPLGDFTFTPTRCRSGQRVGFFGVILMGDGQNDGAVLVIADPASGKSLKVQVPGSCKPPDFEECSEVTVTREQCSAFDLRVEPTHTTVNSIRLLDGQLRVDCAFAGGGSLRGAVRFENCD